MYLQDWLKNTCLPDTQSQVIICNIQNLFLELFNIFGVNSRMKVSAIILFLYVFALTALPCIDVPKDNILQQIELSHNSSDRNHNDADLCSPFCCCNCCVSPIINQDYIIQYNPILLSKDYNSGYITVYISSLFAAIWQPPKIS
jgi:hypothetical protein